MLQVFLQFFLQRLFLLHFFALHFKQKSCHTSSQLPVVVVVVVAVVVVIIGVVVGVGVVVGQLVVVVPVGSNDIFISFNLFVTSKNEFSNSSIWLN